MGQITIKLQFNLETGRKDILIEYESDEDMLAHEHEKRHKEIVEQLIGKGVLASGEVGEVRVTRVKEEGEQELPDPRDEQQQTGPGEQLAEPG